MKLNICAPIGGKVVAIEDIPDPVFAEKMLGDGIALSPGGSNIVYAPCDGEISIVQDNQHAIVINCHEGIDLLIHVGIDTVALKGDGLKAKVQVGDKVKKGDALIDVDFKHIAPKVPSTDIIMVLTDLGSQYKITKTTAHDANLGDVVITVSDGIEEEASDTEEDGSSVGDEAGAKAHIINLTGIHARPASVMFQTAAKATADVQITKEDKTVNGKSVIAILGLGLKYGEEIEITAQGVDAQDVVDKLIALINDGFGEKDTKPIITEEEAVEKSADKIDIKSTKVIKGVTASTGLAIGKSFIYAVEEIEVTKESDDPAGELKIFEDAIAVACEKLEVDIKQAQEDEHTVKEEVFNAHLLILDDPELIEATKVSIARSRTAAYAWKKSIDHTVEVLKTTQNKLLMERIADFRDIENRVLRLILGIAEEVTGFPKDSVVIANELVPSDVLKFDENVVGVIIALGSATSHVALILRNMNIPTVVATGEETLDLGNGAIVVVDSDQEEVLINLTEAEIDEIKDKKEELEKVRKENRLHAQEKAVTLDGVHILVKGNVSNPQEAKQSFALGAEGIGLLRSEFLFFNSAQEPSEEEQRALYQKTLDVMEGGPVTVRTLDVGGDKPLPYIRISSEENPILGMRGVRNYFEHREIFITQLKAILTIRPLVLTKIMFPMVADVSEVEWLRGQVDQQLEKLGITEKVQIGIMIEIPSSAILAEQLARHVDFFSIGTNDLAQYTLAMDRGNPKLASSLSNLHPALLRLIKMTVDGADKSNIPTAVCGAMASEVKAIPLLVGLGIKDLSSSMGSIADIKALIRTLKYEDCKKIVDKCLTLQTAEEVSACVSKEFDL